ncbi:MAG: histidine phosphatase family protein [Kofleriaceae bacterium]|nr:histidine phosphatase family protein [Kofleriaceae bacterium]MCL4223771.1 histidine phosphatase family protein [Myxococcales bacterium]
MIVFLVRHADAVDEAPGLPDEVRHLSARGRDQARALGQRLRWHDCAPTAVWTSPLVRAVMTAELVAAALEWTGPIESVRGLAPAGAVRDVQAALAAHDPAGAVVLVGHEPMLSGLGALLTGRADFPALAKAQAARLDDGAVRWLFAHDAEAPVTP